MKLFIHLLVSTLAVVIAEYLIPGVTIDSYFVALIVAVVLGILNAVLRPLLILLTLPINIFTLGLFTFVINAFLVMLAASVVPGFEVSSFWIALIFSVVLLVINGFMNAIAKKERNKE
ncbi:MAG: phage holin family protein [bacterium]|nr:phage holin family protein [bacterium]